MIDSSIVLGVLLPDGQDALSIRVFAYLEKGGEAHAPQHWWLEVANGLLMAERRKRISPAAGSRGLEAVAGLPIATDEGTAGRACGEIALLARRYRLSLYDAAYLDLAIRTGSSLATADQALGRAAEEAGVPIFG